MKSYLLAGILLLAAALPSAAKSAVIAVTPKQMEHVRFKFAITSSSDSSGRTFHVVVQTIGPKAVEEVSAYLCPARPQASSGVIGPTTAKTRISLTNSASQWSARFVVSNRQLADPDLSFVFCVNDLNGPACDFYVLKLRDFNTH